MSTLLLILMIVMPGLAFSGGVWLGRRYPVEAFDEPLTVDGAQRKIDLACDGCGHADACCALEAFRASGAQVSQRLYHRFSDGGHELHVIVDPAPVVRS